ncbi:hypothetical protein EBR43_11710 [bacterium]|nr:hypothetical protein [bacterium]
MNMQSTLVRGTGKKKTTMNWWEYWIGHCWMTGWQSIRGAFRIWADLMSSNYKDYVLLKDDDPEQECMGWFWVSLGEDNVYPKEFLEYLQQMVDDIETGKEELIPLDEDYFKRLKELVADVELDDEIG